jgi:chlorophyllase
MLGSERILERLGRWPQRIALALAAAWGVAAGLMFVFARIEHAWLVFIGGYQTILLVTALATVLGGLALRRGEWNRALVLGVGTMLAVTTIYLLAVTLVSASAPAGLVALADGTRLQRKPDLALVAPGFYLASLGIGAVLGPGFLLFSPVRPRQRQGLRLLHLPASHAPAVLYHAPGDPYHSGPLAVRTLRLSPGAHGAPAPLLIHTPATPGEYPVVLFQHGFLLWAERFSGVLRHLASHGFVVVAPQMYAPHLPFGTPSSLAEAELAERIIDWMPEQLSAAAGVVARTDTLGVAGHSRGAKVAWWLHRRDHAPIRALAAVDPVDRAVRLAADPRVLDGSFTTHVPALVVGTEFGSVVRSPFTPPAAPSGHNHQQFFAACAAPVWHVLLRGAGHLDMLDEARPGVFVHRGMCLGGADRAAARRATAGLITAFFRATLQGDHAVIRALENPVLAPLPLEVRVKEEHHALRAA